MAWHWQMFYSKDALSMDEKVWNGITPQLLLDRTENWLYMFAVSSLLFVKPQIQIAFILLCKQSDTDDKIAWRILAFVVTLKQAMISLQGMAEF